MKKEKKTKKEINKKDNKKIKEEKAKKQTKKKMKTWKKVLIVILVILAILGGWFAYKTKKNGGGVSGMLATVVGHDEETKKNLPELKILILGVSTDLGDTAPTDTIMVASYNPKEQTANLLSIPRDTYVGKNKAKATPSDKINSLYSYGGAEKTLEAVNKLTGLDIKYYAVVKTEALIKLVDAIGEVNFNVPIDMKYDDPTQNLHINLKAGEQKINGDKAEQLLRFRKNNNGTSYPEEYGDNDTGRMRTQREFIMAVMQQTLKPGNIFKIGQILDIANNYLETNIDFSYIKDYIPYAVEFNTDNLQTATLPGTTPDMKDTNNVSIFVINKKLSTELIQSMFYVDSTEETEDNTITNNINTSSNSISSTTTVKDDELKIELINGSGNTSKLEEAKTKLEEAGFKVNKTGKQQKTISKTLITNKKNATEEQLKNMKKALSAGSISTNKQASSQVDVTIVIGEDFE